MSCELPDAFGERDRKARKDHTCCECAETIPAGQKYTYSHGVWDGHGNSYKTCLHCAGVRSLILTKLRMDEWDDGPAFGRLYLWLQDFEDGSGSNPYAGLTTRAQVIETGREIWTARRKQ